MPSEPVRPGPEDGLRLHDLLHDWPPGRLFGVGVALTATVALASLLLPPVDLLLLLALPAIAAAWFGGPVVGASVAVLGPPLVWGVAHLSEPGPVGGWTALWEVGSDVTILVGMAVFVGYYRARLREEERQASTDPLTQLPNRGAFIDRLEDEIARSSRYGYAFTLLFLDLDGFKEVNDDLGHTEGDRVLVRVADGMRASTRQTDDLGRLGGDEFAALLPFTTVGPARAVIEKLRSTLSRGMEEGGWAVTFSIGAVTFEGPVADGRSALQAADQAMYQVKHSGKDGVQHVVWDGGAPS